MASVGVALLIAGLLFDTGPVYSQAQATPTFDRLAQPTLPADPNQADQGSQVYWLSCLPCHGDRGQGLTEEFIQTYPEEDRNCWTSGCHGARPYEDGFTIPKYIPPVIGEGTLQKFSNAAALRSYIHAAMPYWDPGSLTEEQTWQVTAFMLREGGLWDDSVELNASNADLVLLGLPTATPTPQPLPAAIPKPVSRVTPFAIGLSLLAVVLLLWRIRRR